MKQVIELKLEYALEEDEIEDLNGVSKEEIEERTDFVKGEISKHFTNELGENVKFNNLEVYLVDK